MFTPGALPPAVDAVLGQVRAWSGPAATAPTAAERAAWLVGLRQLVDAAEVVFTEVLAAFDAHGDGETLHGARSSQAWLQAGLHLAPGDASSRVHLARRADVLAGPLEAARSGRVTFDQVAAIERAVRPLAADQRPEAVALLAGLSQCADAGQVRLAGRRLRQVVDPDGALAEHEQQFTRRYLTLSPVLDGMTAVDGLLDTEAAGIVAAALAPLMVPSGPDDDRSAAQRRADALVDVAALALRSEQLPALSGTVASLDVLVPVATLAGTAQADPVQPGGGQGGTLPGHPGGPAVLHAVETGRLACDARVTRILMTADSVPLDLGRTVRLFTGHQRKALAVRDSGCRFPGCTRPARYTDAHHRLSWLRGGATDLSNGLLLCRWHHRAVHEGGWTISPHDPTRGANGRLHFHGPHGQHLTSDPRGP